MSRHVFDRLLRPWGPRRETGCVSLSALSLDVVESGIWPLVQALNQIHGVRTIGSCHGHRGLIVLPYNGNPYVYFQGPSTFALALSEHIDCAYSRERLIYRWRITGLTHPELGQCIYLSLDSRLYLRAKLARDLAWLTQHVASQIGHGSDAAVRDEPDHCQEDDKRHHEFLSTSASFVTERIFASAAWAWVLDARVKWAAAIRILAKIPAAHWWLQETKLMKKTTLDEKSIPESRSRKRAPALTPTERTRRFRDRLSNTGAARIDLHVAPAVADQLANECDRTGETLQAAAHRLIEQALRSRNEEGS
ncbi:hypothetical protein [Burkholderia stagnalis]|uniref:hypothetical protein n=1 Tax=Burkholderia stagnalis TaxID=1503054 RepID=UPI000F57E721|nr:hypothetical protein [Burkholderia stagnalis]